MFHYRRPAEESYITEAVKCEGRSEGPALIRTKNNDILCMHNGTINTRRDAENILKIIITNFVSQKAMSDTLMDMMYLSIFFL